MIAPHRADEITFYEEIGVVPGASPEEIRNAFRTLVRLIHPDQQTDPALKDVAERQMRKLNRIYAVLSDPERRRRYDEVLQCEHRPAVVVRPAFRPSVKQFMGRTASFVAILLGAGLLIWLTPESIPGPQSLAHDQVGPGSYVPPPPSAAATDQGYLIASLRSDLKEANRERSAAVSELSRLRAALTDSQSIPAAQPSETAVEPESPTVILTGLPADAKPPASGIPLPPTEMPSGHILAGSWVYAKQPEAHKSKDVELYQPDRIEATISEQNGRIYGKYRARFHVSRRATSPDVDFAFTGTLGTGPQFTFPWTGAAGAKGELAVKVISENSLRIDWHATELGTQRGPNAGTAVLTRRIE